MQNKGGDLQHDHWRGVVSKYHSMHRVQADLIWNIVYWIFLDVGIPDSAILDDESSA